MLEADLLMLLDDGYAVGFSVSGDLYLVELGQDKTFYGATLREALCKAIDATEGSRLHV